MTILLALTLGPARFPDMMSVVPQHLNLVNRQGREILRFSNGVANMGEGPWRMRPEIPLGTPGTQLAIQEVLDSSDSSGSIVISQVVSEFEFHVEHNHWHIDDIALYELRTSASGGLAPISAGDIGAVAINDQGAAQSIKTTFCLIDWVRYAGNSNNGSQSTRFYWDCNGAYQGISVGWVDQYHHATPGQFVDMTGVPAGRYYLVTTANPDGGFLESNLANNRAWVAVNVERESNGNPKVKLTGDSYTVAGEGLPALYSPNR